jgi:hypothetical protein
MFPSRGIGVQMSARATGANLSAATPRQGNEVRRTVTLLVIALGALASASCSKERSVTPNPMPAPAPDRMQQLQQQVNLQEIESANAVANYVPATNARIDDLNLSAVGALRQLPGTDQVEVAVSAQNPIGRIVKLRDWHFVPKDLYAIDMKHAAAN